MTKECVRNLFKSGPIFENRVMFLSTIAKPWNGWRTPISYTLKDYTPMCFGLRKKVVSNRQRCPWAYDCLLIDNNYLGKLLGLCSCNKRNQCPTRRENLCSHATSLLEKFLVVQLFPTTVKPITRKENITSFLELAFSPCFSFLIFSSLP